MIIYSEYKATNFLKNYIYSFIYLCSGSESEKVVLYPDGADYFLYDGKVLDILSKEKIKKPYILSLEKNNEYFIVRWKPYSLYFLKHNNDIFDQTFKILQQMLQNAKTFHQKKKLIELFIIELCSETKIEHSIVSACDIVFSNKGVIRVEELASNCNLHKRTFQREFKKITYFSPKEYIDIIKLQHTISYLHTKINQFKIAKVDPYYDYSHIYKTFKKYLEITPKELKNSNSFSLKSLFDI